MSNNEKNYITPLGFKRLQAEFQTLRYDERPKLVETISWAASNGDRSENGDYIYGKKRLREIDKRLRFLTKQIDSAEIVDPTTVTATRILFGAKVTVEDCDGAQKVYYIVGADESEPEKGKISWKSPIAMALFKKEVGDVATYRTPRGEFDVEIIAIEYCQVPE